MTPSALHLSERIFALRAAASAVYDRGFAVGKSPEELRTEIEPLTKALDKIINQAAVDDLPGCVMAVQRLETQARAHEEDAKFLIEKADNARHHAQSVKDAVTAQMKREGVSEKRVGGFTLVLVRTADGLDELVLR